MGKMMAITDKQSCSPACSDSHHYPGKSIMRHGWWVGGEGEWIHLAATFNQWQHPGWQLSARHMSGRGLLSNPHRQEGREGPLYSLTSAPCCDNVDNQQKTEAETRIKVSSFKWSSRARRVTCVTQLM